MKSLAARILELVPGATGGLSLRAAVKALGQDIPHTRAAFEALDKSGRARLFRRGRGGALYLAPPDSAVLICAIETCRTEFQRAPKSKRLTCSRACHGALGWKDPVKAAKRRAAISTEHRSPEARARTAAHNKRRWSKPGEREKLALQNARRWKGRIEEFERYRAKMRIIQTEPERRKMYSDLRKEWWADPKMRKKMTDAVNASEAVQEYRKNFGKFLKLRWADPEFRAKYTAANRARNTPERGEKTSKRMKKLWADPVWSAEVRRKIAESRAET